MTVLTKRPLTNMTKYDYLKEKGTKNTIMKKVIKRIKKEYKVKNR